MMKGYTVKYRRKREGKTDYRARLKMLASGKYRVVVRRMLNNITVQFVELNANGDRTLATGSTMELLKYGWNAHRGNVPSAYLAGYLCGLKAKKKGLAEGILDFGMAGVVNGSTFFGVAKGLLDAGINVRCSEEVLPGQDKLSGKTIADYAEMLAKSNKDLYSRQFSNYLRNNLRPEELPKHFEEIKERIEEKWQ